MRFDAIVVGGGFYGARIALHLAREHRLGRVLLLERAERLLLRASLANQARVHRGYHYPRSFVTAQRSQVNFRRFVADYPEAVRSDFLQLYAIARRGSKVSARQFERFCDTIGAPLAPAPPHYGTLFHEGLIEAVFATEEYAFDAAALARALARDLAANAVDVRCRHSVGSIERRDDALLVAGTLHDGGSFAYTAKSAFVCTYSALDALRPIRADTPLLKHEIAEIALVEPPAALADVGVTVMDGPFFSTMPFPARGLHSFSHVRYTPHSSWSTTMRSGRDVLREGAPRASRVDLMLRDGARYLPLIANSRPVQSLFELKTVLADAEGNDGRPILFQIDASLPGCHWVLGGKLDNVYDVLERIDSALADENPWRARA